MGGLKLSPKLVSRRNQTLVTAYGESTYADRLCAESLEDRERNLLRRVKKNGTCGNRKVNVGRVRRVDRVPTLSSASEHGQYWALYK